MADPYINEGLFTPIIGFHLGFTMKPGNQERVEQLSVRESN
jgi:hypothetical protein